MDIRSFLGQYWPLLALGAWFVYKWWRSRRVTALLPALIKRGALLVDVRSLAEFASENAPGTVNIPLPELSSRLAEIPKSAPVVLACASGSRSGMAKMVLKSKGYTEVYNVGNWRNFLAAQVAP
jgi:rhodanese-related sulfurtransferase